MSVFAAVGLAGAMVVAVSGAAFAQSRTFDVGPFTGVDISSGLDAEITVGPAVSVSAEARNPEYLDDLKVEVRGNRLYAWVDRNILDFRFGDDRRVHVRITAPSLDFVQAGGGSDVSVGNPSGDRLEAHASGGADLNVTGIKAAYVVSSGSSGSDIRLAGTCDSATFDVSSGSDLKASDLQCKDVVINAASGSDAEVFASASMTANASSGSDVEVLGKPGTVKQDVSSGAGVKVR